jgi:ABC-type multidrug transport system permease subunit
MLIIDSFYSVLVSPAALPRFWIFMYRVSPVTYLVSAMVSTGVAGVNVVCAANEIVRFNPPSGQTCSSYLKAYMSYMGGTLLNPSATEQCEFCRSADTDSVLASRSIYFEDRWRNFGISLIYSAVNVVGALCLYYLFRVPKGPRRRNV